MPREPSPEGQRDLRLRMGKGTSWQAPERKTGAGKDEWRREPGGALAQGSLPRSLSTSEEKAEPSHFPLAVYF